MSSQKLRKLCENKSLKIEKCRKPGYWMVGFSERPNTEQFLVLRKTSMLSATTTRAMAVTLRGIIWL